jgi:uncharacterized protein (DUF2147 family)
MISETFAQSQIAGNWLSADKEGIIQIYEFNGKSFGKLVWLKKPKDEKGKPFLDTENPIDSLKRQPLLSLLILKNFVYSNNEWRNGTIYDPNNGKTFTCKMWLTDINTLKVRGNWGIFYQTQTWTRQKE